MIARDVFAHQRQAAGKQHCNKHHCKQQIATGGLAAQHAAFPALQSCNGPCKCCYEIIRNYAAGKCEPNEKQLVVVVRVGLENQHFTQQPYNECSVVEQSVLLFFGKQRNRHQNENESEILDIEPKPAVTDIAPIKSPTQERVVVHGLFKRESEKLRCGKHDRNHAEQSKPTHMLHLIGSRLPSCLSAVVNNEQNRCCNHKHRQHETERGCFFLQH